MIQRKQTVFLLLAVILVVVCSMMQVGQIIVDGQSVARVYNLCIVDNQGQSSFKTWPMLMALILSAVDMLVAIFMYKKRRLQARLCLVAVMLLLCWYVLLAVLPQAGGTSFKLAWTSVLPAVAVILAMMARKGVIDDEKLVRSLDRIR